MSSAVKNFFLGKRNIMTNRFYDPLQIKIIQL